ncbi:MAG: (2Fe-2S) ferredoxin domain-containing protein [Acholeplasmataceae bacterium]|nr:NAD(P)H-dependent oxidoreductase subunit E [Acidaminococcaceae bacterium]NLY83572.1 (2Fe-2S) ferredoxin domain-containing protein [Acholeplasmataceae bacterium]
MKVVVCVGSNCTMMGADSIIASLENLKDTLLQKEGANPAFTLEIEMARCLGECKKKNAVSPVVIVDGEMYRNASREQIMSVVLDAAYEYILPK